MKRKYILFVILLLVVILIIGVFSWWNINSKPVSSNEQITRFVIPRGRSATQIGGELFEEGLIRNPLVFKVYVQATGKAKKIQSGQYTLSPNFTLKEIVTRLTSGPEELWVTIPEGLRREEIVEKFISGLEMDEEQISVFRQEFLAESQGQEGFLFPDTYLFPREATASQVVGKLRNTFDAKVESLQEDITEGNYTLNEIVTLASIIERETKKGEERPIVAGILFKRLENGVLLQADATVQYALANVECRMSNVILRQAQDDAERSRSIKCDNWWPVIIRADWEINSPYNTYKFSGLPPAPIASPGLSSLEAAVNPLESDYWYYIHDKDGIIHYASSLDEHVRNIDNYLDN